MVKGGLKPALHLEEVACHVPPGFACFPVLASNYNPRSIAVKTVRFLLPGVALALCAGLSLVMVSTWTSQPARLPAPGMNVEILGGDIEVCPGDELTFLFVTRMLNGMPGIEFRDVFVISSICGTLTLVGGDDNNNGVLDYGEEWTNACTVTVFESTTLLAMDGADAYFAGEFIGPVSGEDQAQVTVVSCNPGCTLTLGFWKTHPEAWALENMTLGGVTYTGEEALEILDASVTRDASIILAHQFIPALLNIASGADPVAVADTLLAADAWFVDHPVGSNPKGRERSVAIHLARTLDDYNNGEIGPGRCED